MKTVNTCFTLTYSSEQYQHARKYVEDMKRHPRRVYWQNNVGKSDEELILSHIAHRILSGFYNQYDPHTRRQITDMTSVQDAN